MTKISITKTNESRLKDIDFDNLGFGKYFSDHMFVSDYLDGVWQNHRIIPTKKMEMHPANMALHYGQSIFEGLKASKGPDGVPLLFRPEKNIARLNVSASRMCMPEFSEDLMLEAMKLLVQIDSDWIPSFDGSSLYLRPVMFATDEYLGVAPSKTYRLVILTCPSGLYYSKPVKLLAEDHYVRAAIGGIGEAKAAGNYAGAMYPTKLAQSKGYDQILWLDAIYHKYAQEVGTMNIFFVFKDIVVTPLTDGAILHGITRESIIEICNERGIRHEERLISIDEIFDEYASGNLIEIFGAGTAAVVTNVQSLTYQGKTIVFDDDRWELSKEMKRTINGIRNGTVEDTLGFILPVIEASLV